MFISSVSVGVEDSMAFGQCPGAKIDAINMHNILKTYSQDSILLLDKKATRDNVSQFLNSRVDISDLVIMFYAGHGGQRSFSRFSENEDDGKDEFLCLYDTYLLDNSIWKVVQRAKGKVFLIFDCCHSETMFAVPNPFKASINPKGYENVNMLCWSACAESKVSYGSLAGGSFTNTFLKYYDKDKLYYDIWNEIRNDEELKKSEIVKCTQFGEGFEGKIFS